MSRMIPLFSSWQRLAGNRRLFALCLLLFVASAVFSTWLFFPVDTLQRRLLQEVSRQTGIDMRGRNATMLFPLGLGLDLSIYPDFPGLKDLDLTELQISPVWRSLFSADKKVNVAGTLAEGKIIVNAAKNGLIDLKFKGIALAALQQEGLPYRVAGKIAGQLAGENISEEMRGRGEFSLQLTDAQVLGLEKVGLPVSFFAGILRLEGKFDQRRFSLEKVALTGGSLDLSGGGNVLIGESYEQTRLNMNVRLQPTATTPDSLLQLFNLTGLQPTADGSYLLRIGGTLAKPVIR